MSDYQFPEDMIIENKLGEFFIPKNSDTAGRITSYWEQDLRKHFYIKDKVIFIDVGANAGIYSVFMAKRFPKAKIYAIEPAPFTYKTLKKNISLNNLSQTVKAFNIGLSNKKGKIKLAFNKGQSSLAYVLNNNETLKKGYKIIEVKVTTLDDFISQNKIAISKINLIKIDVEDHEFFVLKGAKSLLKNLLKGSRLIVEIVEGNAREKELLTYMNFNKFTYKRLNENNFLFIKQ